MTNNTTISVDLGKDVTYELMIERLGGYEKMSKYVKETLADLGNDVPYDTDCYQFETEISFQFGQLQKALLAYRRAHNIYEVGDRVVLLKNQHMWHKMESIYTVDSTDIYEGVTIGVAIRHNNTSFGDELGNIRHATDEEIAAGRRLDQ